MPLPTVTLVNSFGDPWTFLVTQGQWQIPYLELADGYHETWAKDGVQVTRVCACKWEDRRKFRDDMLGYSEYVPGYTVGGVQTNLKRFIPEQHPDISNLYASACDMNPAGMPTSVRDDIAKALTSRVDYVNLVGVDQLSNMIRYNLAVFTVTYTSRPFTVLKDADVPSNSKGEFNRYVTPYYTTSGSNQRIPGNAFIFVSDIGSTKKSPIQEGGAFTIPVVEIQYVWHQVPRLNLTNITQVVGRCNNAAFDDWPAEQLICLAPKIEFHEAARGGYFYDITFIMANRAYENADWNSLFRTSVGAGQPGAGKPGFEKIVYEKDGTTKLTKTADFNLLFKL